MRAPQSLKPSSFTHVCYRCDKTVFYVVLVAVENTLLAQAVLTLRSVLFCRDGLVLVMTE